MNSENESSVKLKDVYIAVSHCFLIYSFNIRDCFSQQSQQINQRTIGTFQNASTHIVLQE